MALERDVAAHYTRGNLLAAIESGLADLGKSGSGLLPADLAPVDEFHVGGRQATIDLAERMDLRPGLHLLDIGCGIGGASRYFAAERCCRVTGLDLTDEYCRVATRLAALVGLSDRVWYCQGSALDLPFSNEAFDGAYMLHVGMNVADKPALLAQVRRVLKKGAVFGLYEILQGPSGEPHFPVPWAPSPATSFLVTPTELKTLLAEAGFGVVQTRDRTAFGLAFFQAMRARIEKSGVPPLGLHLLMGNDSPAKMGNMIRNLEEARVVPTEMVARAL